jgi:RNA polymerase sigma factor (sigma-70 family)
MTLYVRLADDDDPANHTIDITTEEQALVERALLGLPMSFREVLVLRHFEERGTAEVAALLDLPEATVRTRLKRGRDMLIEALTRMERAGGGTNREV